MKPANVYVIGDTQVRPGVVNPLYPVAWDIVETLPDYVVHLGDHWDYPSLSSYDKHKNSFRDECYFRDTRAGNLAMQEFWEVIELGKRMHPDWDPSFEFITGNHENRRDRALDIAPSEYVEVIKLIEPDLSGWRVHGFLKPFEINGVFFSHYFANDFSGRAISTASAILKNKHRSFVCGHKQVLDYAKAIGADGRRMMGLIMGACYFHDEDYKGPLGNKHFRGTAYLRNVFHGEWEMEIRNLRTLQENLDETG